VDMVLIGRFWGAAPLGIYQKAYGLLMLPINQVNAPISGVAVAGLSRVQTEPERMRRYFLAGYEIAASMIVPIICAMTIFADEVVVFLLGPQWSDAIGIFRLLAPAALIGALLNPFGWLFISTGRPDRQLKLACVWTSLIILAFVLGLNYGARGVAFGYSAMSCVLAFPVVWYAIQGTPLRLSDIVRAIWRPALAALAMAPLGWLLKTHLTGLPIGLRAIFGCAFVLVGYALLLLIAFGRWRKYSELIRQAIGGQPQTNTSACPG
jgi:O-antigen/teichoic acid export membrane protein